MENLPEKTSAETVIVPPEKDLFNRIKKVGNFVHEKDWEKVWLSAKTINHNSFEMTIHKMGQMKKGISKIAGGIGRIVGREISQKATEYTLRVTNSGGEREYELFTNDGKWHRTRRKVTNLMQKDDVLLDFVKRVDQIERAKKASDEERQRKIRRREKVFASNDQNDASDILNNIESWNVA